MYPPITHLHGCRRGSGALILVTTLAVVISLIAISTAKISQASQSSLASSKTALQAQQYAAAEAEIIKATNYNDLQAQGKTNITSDYAKEISLSEESDYKDEIKQRTATVKIYKGNEALPRYSLDVIRMSKEKTSGVPIGTIIAWASSKNPSDGIWLECNGQSCAAYPALRNVLGKATVPDYRGVFLRGYGSHTSTHYGNVTHTSGSLGALQGDAIRNMQGDFTAYQFTGYHNQRYYASGVFSVTGGYKFGGNQDAGDHSAILHFEASGSTPVANEIRPINIAVRYLIKAA